MSRAEADFSYALRDGVLVIWDLDLGNKSVPNDAENGRLVKGRKMSGPGSGREALFDREVQAHLDRLEAKRKPKEQS
ncbi:MAG TPA: hypothetical protein VGD78_00235 [Chthoniobacterales bacterium]